MPAGGSQKGERRGGRKRGTPNKKTVERKLAEDRENRLQNGQPIKLLGKEVIEQFMHFFAGLASQVQPRGERPSDPHQAVEYDRRTEQFERWAKNAVVCAKELAPYQSPTFRAITVAPAPGNNGRRVTEFTLKIFDDDREVIEHEQRKLTSA